VASIVHVFIFTSGVFHNCNLEWLGHRWPKLCVGVFNVKHQH